MGNPMPPQVQAPLATAQAAPHGGPDSTLLASRAFLENQPAQGIKRLHRRKC